MGFLSGLVKGIGNVITAPIKSAGNILTGKGNIGDLLSIGAAFAPGANIGSVFSGGGLGSLTTKNLLTNFGSAGLLGQMGLGQNLFNGKGTGMDYLNAFQSLGGLGMTGPGSGPRMPGQMPPILPGQVPQYSLAAQILKMHGDGKVKLAPEQLAYYQGIAAQDQGAGSAQSPYKIGDPQGNLDQVLSGRFGHLLSDIRFGNEMQPIRQSIIRRAVDDYSPNNLMTIATENTNQANQATDRLASQELSAMGASGVSSGVMAGRGREFTNMKVENANDAFSKAMSPQNRMMMTDYQIRALDDRSLDDRIAGLSQMVAQMKSQGLAEKQYKDSKPTTMGTLAGLAGQWLGNGGAEQINNWIKGGTKQPPKTTSSTTGRNPDPFNIRGGQSIENYNSGLGPRINLTGGRTWGNR
jgi:hypothetical protein